MDNGVLQVVEPRLTKDSISLALFSGDEIQAKIIESASQEPLKQHGIRNYQNLVADYESHIESSP